MNSLAQDFEISFWRKTDDQHELFKEIRSLYVNSQPFAQLLHAAVIVELKGGQIVIQGKLSAQRVLRHVLDKLKGQEVADVPSGAFGKWQWLELKENRFTGRRVWQKVSRTRAWTVSMSAPYAELPFSLMRVLGYPADITWEQAERVWARHSGPRGFRLFSPARVIDRSHDLKAWDNEHFRDDRGSYDDAGVLRKVRRRETWESAYATRLQAANRDPRIGRYGISRRIRSIGEVGLAEIEDHHRRLEQARASLAQRQVTAPRQPAEAPWWQLRADEREMLRLQENLRARVLQDEDAEVADHALADVPQSMLELLEEQLAEVEGKAPRGLVGAVARERLAALERKKAIQQETGLEALTAALAA
jgi:hypothetical protein